MSNNSKAIPETTHGLPSVSRSYNNQFD